MRIVIILTFIITLITPKAFAVSIEGTLLMLDDKTPHVACVVQAVTSAPDDKDSPTVAATTLSNENGRYKFTDLQPGRYQVRCYTLEGYIYYQDGKVLAAEGGKTLTNINFRFPPFKKGTWRNYDTLDGLGYNAVIDIYRDPDGVMWFATESGGVSRYDGKEFVSLTIEDGLVHNLVYTIHRDPDGAMWFGTMWGVSRYDGKKFVNLTQTTNRDGFLGGRVSAIHRDPDGVMWFGTEYGISRYDGKEFINLTTEDGLVHNFVNAIYRDPDDILWFAAGRWGSEGGVSRYDGREFVNLTTEDGLANNCVRTIHRDPDGVMWFGTEGGVSRYDGKEFVSLTIEDGLVHNLVHAIHRDSDGVMWFGTGGGISRYDGNTCVNFTTKDGLTNNWVNVIYRDPDGMMWFGTGGGIEFERGGVSRYDSREFVNFTVRDGLADNNVMSIHCDPDGVMWFGTEYGISRYDGKEFINLTTEDGLVHNFVNAIYRDPDDILWFAAGRWGSEGGVSRYDGREFVNLTTEDGLVHNFVYAIDRDPDGMMWFGTHGGVSRYDGKEFVNLTTKDGLPHYIAWSIHSAPDGTMWFGTWDGGVSQYDGKEFVTFTTEDGLVSDRVSTIDRDPDGIMWFGTWGGGVSRYDGKRFVNFTTEDGLAKSLVSEIYRAQDGAIWFGTDGGGTSCYDGDAWSSLDTRDGLAGNSVFSIHQDSEGFLWFGTEGGITRYRRSSTPPKVHIVSVTTNQIYRDLDAVAAFTPGTRVTIEYSSIDFKTVPGKRQYRCRIIGIPPNPHTHWRKPTRATSSDFIFDQPGSYTFEVQAIDRDLNYSEPDSMTLKVVPPFYLRASFLAPIVSLSTILIVVLTIVSIGYLKRRRQVQAYQQAAVLELQDANQVQMSLMPDTAPPVEGLEIAGRCLPANTVSGDFFDYVEGKRPNEVTLVVADVCGKAMKGAMNAVMTDGILRAAAIEQEHFTPASLMTTLNDALKGRLERYMNVTMVIGTIDADAKTLTLANAAHHAYPLLRHDGEVETLKTGGMPLGMMAGIQYTEEKFPLQSGDVVVFMTDGIIETQADEEQQYSDSGRLEETIRQFTPEQSAEAMVDAIINDAIDYSGDKAQRDDDMTVVVAKML